MSRQKRNIHVINVPLDLGASRRGTDGGPSAFRIAGLKQAIRDLGHDVAGETDIDVPLPESRSPASPEARFRDEILAVCEDLAEASKAVLARGETPLVIGGDHSIAMGTVSGVSAHFSERGEKLGLLWFDAHGDMNLPGTSPSGNIHGMPLAHLLGKGDAQLSSILGVHPAVVPDNVALIGIRDIDDVEREIINSSGIAAFTMHDIDKLGMGEVSRRALEVVNKGTAGFHISFDLDGCDPDVIPGSGTLVPGGVSFREAHFLLEECAMDGRITSMEVVELNPFLDHANISAERAVTLIQSAFGRSIL
jgi:arginase